MEGKYGWIFSSVLCKSWGGTWFYPSFFILIYRFMQTKWLEKSGISTDKRSVILLEDPVLIFWIWTLRGQTKVGMLEVDLISSSLFWGIAECWDGILFCPLVIDRIVVEWCHESDRLCKKKNKIWWISISCQL